MIKAEVIFGAQETFLNGPAQSGGGCKLGERCSRSGIGEIIGQSLGILEAAADEQPALKPFLCGPSKWNSSPGVKPWSLGSLAGRQGVPGISVKPLRHGDRIGLDEMPVLFQKPQTVIRANRQDIWLTTLLQLAPEPIIGPVD